jgi:hypothetical protein
MSSAKAALESDTRVHTFLESPMVLPHAYSYLQAFFFLFRFLLMKQVEKAKSE